MLKEYQPENDKTQLNFIQLFLKFRMKIGIDRLVNKKSSFLAAFLFTSYQSNVWPIHAPLHRLFPD